jgi:hypothetical protein
MEEVEAGARIGLRLLRCSRSSTPPSRVEHIEKFLRSGISFVRMARGAAYPPQSRRRACEKRDPFCYEEVSRTEGTVCVIACKSGSCASSVRRFVSSETILVPTNSSPPVPIRNVPPPLQSHFEIARVPSPALTSDVRQQIILHASSRCCPTRQELLRRRWLRLPVLFLRGKPRPAQWQPRRRVYLCHFRRPQVRLPLQNFRPPIRDGSLG